MCISLPLLYSIQTQKEKRNWLKTHSLQNFSKKVMFLPEWGKWKRWKDCGKITLHHSVLCNSVGKLIRGIISYYISIFQERIISPVKSELYVIQERIMDGSDWLICSAECLTNSKYTASKLVEHSESTNQ